MPRATARSNSSTPSIRGASPAAETTCPRRGVGADLCAGNLYGPARGGRARGGRAGHRWPSLTVLGGIGYYVVSFATGGHGIPIDNRLIPHLESAEALERPFRVWGRRKDHRDPPEQEGSLRRITHLRAGHGHATMPTDQHTDDAAMRGSSPVRIRPSAMRRRRRQPPADHRCD